MSASVSVVSVGPSPSIHFHLSITLSFFSSLFVSLSTSFDGMRAFLCYDEYFKIRDDYQGTECKPFYEESA